MWTDRKTPGNPALILICWSFLSGLPSAESKGATEPLDWIPNPEIIDRHHLLPLHLDGGLVDDGLFSIDFDSDGTAWIASGNGLIRYDGYRWTRFTTDHGLPSNFVRCVYVSGTNEVWIGTDRGAGVFDGAAFDSRGSESGLAGSNVRRIFRDRQGTLWFCCDQWPVLGTRGGLSALRQGRWTQYTVADGLPSEYAVDFFESRDGRRFVATSGGVARWRDGRWEQVLPVPGANAPEESQPINWTSTAMVEVPGLGVVVSTGRRIYVEAGDDWRLLDDDSNANYGLCVTADGTLIACVTTAARMKAFSIWGSDGWEPATDSFSVPRGYVEMIKEAPDGSVWAVGYGCLERWSRRRNEWDILSGLPPPKVVDRDGSVWFADEERTVRSFDGRFRLWKRGTADREWIVSPAGRAFSWSDQQLTDWTSGEPVPVPLGGVETSRIDGVAFESRQPGIRWIHGSIADDGRAGLWWFDGEAWIAVAVPGLNELTILSVRSDPDQGLWLHTKAPGTGYRYVHVTMPGGRVDVYSSGGDPDPAISMPTFDGGMHIDPRGDAWLLGDNGLFLAVKDRQNWWRKVSGLPGQQVLAAFDMGGATWFVCNGALGGRSGLFRYAAGDADQVPLKIQFHASQALDETLMFGVEGGFSYLPPANEGGPIRVRLPIPGTVTGAVREIDGTFWLATDQRVLRFSPDGIDPETDIHQGIDQLLTGQVLTVGVHAAERFHPRNSEDLVAVSWKLDDGPWSPFTVREQISVATGDLRIGSHILRVRSRDEGNDMDRSPAILEFSVVPIPIQERWWFGPSAATLITVFAALTVGIWSTKRKLATSEALYRTLTEAAPQVIWASDASGAVYFFNETWYRFSGLTEAESLGDGWIALLHPDDAERVTTAFRRARKRSTPFQGECRFLTRQQGCRSVSFHVVPVRGGGARVDHWVGINTDVTERKAAEEALQAAHRELESFSYSVSHDLRAPLRGIDGYGAALLEDHSAGLDAGGVDLVNRLLGVSKRMRELIDALLELSRVNRQPIARESVDVSRMAGEILDALKAQDPARSTAWRVAPGLSAAADPRLARVALENLLANAWKFTAGRQGALIEVDSASDGQGNWLLIRDNGVGFDPEMADRLFSPFQRLHSVEDFPGTGIGLATVRRVVHRHGGKIRAESRKNGGATFFFTFSRNLEH